MAVFDILQANQQQNERWWKEETASSKLQSNVHHFKKDKNKESEKKCILNSCTA